MAYLADLGIYQAKVLMTASAIVEIDDAIAAAHNDAERTVLTRNASGLRAMLRMYEGMVTFLNCCVEIEAEAAGRQDYSSQEAVKKQA